LNKKIVIIVLGFSLLDLVMVLLSRFLPKDKKQFTEVIPDNLASKVCQKISQPEGIYSCLEDRGHLEGVFPLKSIIYREKW